MGLLSTSSEAGSAVRTPSVASFAMRIGSSNRLSGTSRRLDASQDSPTLFMHRRASVPTTDSRTASSRTRLGDLPPSSSITRLTVGAAWSETSTPARVDPVNETKPTFGRAAMQAPTFGRVPSVRLKTPGGTSASSRIPANRCTDSGEISEGFNTQVQPVASTGATLAATRFIGQFQGVLSAQTPIGSRATVLSSVVVVSKLKDSAASRTDSRCLRPADTCGPSVVRLTTRSTSSSVASSTRPIRVSVAGFSSSMIDRSEANLPHSPFM